MRVEVWEKQSKEKKLDGKEDNQVNQPDGLAHLFLKKCSELFKSYKKLTRPFVFRFCHVFVIYPFQHCVELTRCEHSGGQAADFTQWLLKWK